MAVNAATSSKSSAWDGFKICAKKAGKNLFNLTSVGFLYNCGSNIYNGEKEPLKKAVSQTNQSMEKAVNCVFGNQTESVHKAGQKVKQQRIENREETWFDRLTK